MSHKVAIAEEQMPNEGEDWSHTLQRHRKIFGKIWSF